MKSNCYMLNIKMLACVVCVHRHMHWCTEIIKPNQSVALVFFNLNIDKSDIKSSYNYSNSDLLKNYVRFDYWNILYVF